MWEYRAALTSVTDGDTVKLLMDTGFSGRQEESIRLAGVYAPELRATGGAETKAFVEGWMAGHEMTGYRWPLRVLTMPNTKPEPDELRSFTRYIGQVYARSDQSSLNEAINQFLAAHPEWGAGIT